jgi:hypothetical protein
VQDVQAALTHLEGVNVLVLHDQTVVVAVVVDNFAVSAVGMMTFEERVEERVACLDLTKYHCQVELERDDDMAREQLVVMEAGVHKRDHN